MVVTVAWRVLFVVSLIKPGLLMSISTLVISVVSVSKGVVCVYLFSSSNVFFKIFGGCWSEV